MNTYLTKSKVELIKKAQKDLFDLYGITHTPFTRKIYFYFFTLNGKKYVHKESLKFVYSNADTYTKEIDPYFCNLTKEIIPVDVCTFLENYSGTLLPNLLESNDKFFVYEYFEGEPVEHINMSEFYKLKSQHQEMVLTPFYNSMTYNLIRAEDDIKLVDFKHFEPRVDRPFFIYLYNKDSNINKLYIEKGTERTEIDKHLIVDYPVTQADVIEY